MMPAGGGAGRIRPRGPPPPAVPPAGPPDAPPPGLPGLMLPQAVYHNLQCLMVLHHPFRSGCKRLAAFLASTATSLRQMDYSLQSDAEVTLQDVTESTTIGRERRDALNVSEEAQDTLNRGYDLRPAQRAAGRTDEVIEREIDVLRTDHERLQRDYDDWMDRVPRGGDYLNYVLTHGTKLGTETNNYRRLPRSTNGFKHYDC